MPPSEDNPLTAKYQPPKAEVAKAPEFVGVVSSKVSKVIAADFEGKVTAVKIRNGQRVTAGQIVAELDTTDLKNKLAQAKGQYDAAKGQRARAGAAYSNAARQAKMERRLIISGAAAPAALDNARATASQFGADGASAAGQMASAAA